MVLSYKTVSYIYRCLQCGDKRFNTIEKLDNHTVKYVLGFLDCEEELPEKNKNDVCNFQN